MFTMWNKTIWSVIVLLPLVSSGFAQEWPAFKSTEENFTISLPREPKQERTTGRSPLGNGHHIYSLDSGDVSFTVSISVIDPPLTKPKDIKQTFDFARDMVAMVTAGKLREDSDISLDGFPGRQIRIEKGKQIWTLRAYLVKQRLYQLMTTEPKGKDTHPSVAKFFESFKLLQPPQ
jgi:hypothetical protein